LHIRTSVRCLLVAVAVAVATAIGCATTPPCRLPREPVAATAHVVGRVLAFVNAQPTACPEPGPTYTRLTGRVDTFGPLGLQSVPFVRIELIRKTSLIAAAATDAQGAFQIRDVVDPGEYEVVVRSDRYDGHAWVVLDGRTPEVSIVARAR